MARGFLNGITLGNVGRVSNSQDPVSSQDLVTLAYLQNFVNGLTHKNAVRVATTTNISITSAPSSVDGVTLANGDRILLKNQTTASENGIRVFTAAAAALNLANDSTSANLAEGDTVFAAEGTVNQSTSWTLQSNKTTWVQTGGTATSYTAGTNGGLHLVSGAFSILLPASSGLVTDATGLHIDTSIVVRKYAVSIGDGTSTTITVTHNLGTLDVDTRMYTNSGGAEVDADIVHATTNTITVTFASAPTTNQYRVVVQG